MNSKTIFIAITIVLAIGVAIAFSRSSPSTTNQTLENGGAKTSTATASSEKPDSQSSAQASGAAKSALTSLPQTANAPAQADGKPAQDKKPDPADYGRTQPVRADANPQVASVAEALKGKNHPERLSPIIPPKAFDPEGYKQDPKRYLDTVEPGRCFQSKTPEKNTPKIQPLTPQLQEITQSQSVKLQVRAAPKFPVTFTSFDLGKFSNDLTSITVEANDSGLAETKFFGTPGTIDEVNILAASPMASGQVKFIVNVKK